MKQFLLLVFFGLNISCRTTSAISFENRELEKEVKAFLKELKKSKLDIMSVVVESYREQDSVFIRLSNSYPAITKIKAYAKYQEIYFCFAGEYPLTGYYKIINPEPVPAKLKSAYDDIENGKIGGSYEPFTKSLTFYRGKLEKSEVYNKE